MPVTRKYGCPDCDHVFSFLHLTSDEPAPEYCPACGHYMGIDPQAMPSAPAIGTWKGKVVDQTYRMVEEGGQIRADITGDPTQKITNMKDNLREGDVAAIAPQPSQDYQQAVTAMSGGNPNYWGNAAGGIPISDAVALAKQGASQGTGAQAMAAIQDKGGMLALPKIKGIQPSWGGVR